MTPMTPIAIVRWFSGQSDRRGITVLLDLLGAAVVLGWRPGRATRVRVRIGDLVADQAAHSDGKTTSR